MVWDEQYRAEGAVWGEGPSELASTVAQYVREHDLGPRRLLDVGCGYGRDSGFFARELGLEVVGIDTSAEAIELAREREPGVDFRVADFDDLGPERFGIVFASNVYHLLGPDDRRRLLAAAPRLLAPGGLFAINALSVNDPQEYGKGDPVPGEEHSFKGDKYKHFFTEEELERDLATMRVCRLHECRYDEPHQGGPTHHHVAWVCLAEVWHPRSAPRLAALPRARAARRPKGSAA